MSKICFLCDKSIPNQAEVECEYCGNFVCRGCASGCQNCGIDLCKGCVVEKQNKNYCDICFNKKED